MSAVHDFSEISHTLGFLISMPMFLVAYWRNWEIRELAFWGTLNDAAHWNRLHPDEEPIVIEPITAAGIERHATPAATRKP
jgi:hypothetical protein